MFNVEDFIDKQTLDKMTKGAKKALDEISGYLSFQYRDEKLLTFEELLNESVEKLVYSNEFIALIDRSFRSKIEEQIPPGNEYDYEPFKRKLLYSFEENILDSIDIKLTPRIPSNPIRILIDKEKLFGDVESYMAAVNAARAHIKEKDPQKRSRRWSIIYRRARSDSFRASLFQRTGKIPNLGKYESIIASRLNSMEKAGFFEFMERGSNIRVPYSIGGTPYPVTEGRPYFKNFMEDVNKRTREYILARIQEAFRVTEDSDKESTKNNINKALQYIIDGLENYNPNQVIKGIVFGEELKSRLVVRQRKSGEVVVGIRRYRK